jgi:hypothetical protein
MEDPVPGILESTTSLSASGRRYQGVLSPILALIFHFKNLGSFSIIFVVTYLKSLKVLVGPD